jgi:hypothetical protein
VKTIEAPKLGETFKGEVQPDVKKFDQKFIDEKVSEFPGAGHPSGTKSPGSEPELRRPESPEMLEHRKKHQHEWQRQKDDGTRDKLFGQSASGKVDGNEVEPFSSKALADEAESVSETVKGKKADPARTSSIFRTALYTAGISAPFTALVTTGSLTLTNYLKTKIDPAADPGLSKQDIKNAEIVNQCRDDVFVAVNTLNDFNKAPHVAPGLNWVIKDNDERMDFLEELLDVAEKQLVIKAGAVGIDFTPSSTGQSKDDIKERALDIESRLAAITALFQDIDAALIKEDYLA